MRRTWVDAWQPTEWRQLGLGDAAVMWWWRCVWQRRLVVATEEIGVVSLVLSSMVGGGTEMSRVGFSGADRGCGDTVLKAEIGGCTETVDEPEIGGGTEETGEAEFLVEIGGGAEETGEKGDEWRSGEWRRQLAGWEGGYGVRRATAEWAMRSGRRVGARAPGDDGGGDVHRRDGRENWRRRWISRSEGKCDYFRGAGVWEGGCYSRRQIS
ncbi:Os04g0661500 [Oryza sativa Japonica Group]|uniref:Os04g0661500 protein n=1 Tax=Oryza sativa subsp. japonica TaxID=39947 RepID=A0A0P0WG01_ORYSJ|nr:Os04g0661500 [Oryza sativa Japonica Group]